jgi:hypothetical protein
LKPQRSAQRGFVGTAVAASAAAIGPLCVYNTLLHTLDRDRPRASCQVPNPGSKFHILYIIITRFWFTKWDSRGSVRGCRGLCAKLQTPQGKLPVQVFAILPVLLMRRERSICDNFVSTLSGATQNPNACVGGVGAAAAPCRPPPHLPPRIIAADCGLRALKGGRPLFKQPIPFHCSTEK